MPDKVYTRRGDDGTTQLFGEAKARISKASGRPSAYGEVDEAVASLGVARALAAQEGDGELAEIVLGVQRELFVLAAELATPPARWDRLTEGVSMVGQAMVDGLEGRIDDLEGRFEQPKDFIVPGNTSLGASLDLACRVIRRAERAIVRLVDEGEEVRPEALRYVNRLSDLCWMMARYAERSGRQPRPREG